MLSTNSIRPFLHLLISLYFLLINSLFRLYNSFIPRRSVPPLDPSDEDIPLLQLSARQAAEAIRQGRISSSALVGAYVRRARKVNPLLNAVVHECYEQALSEAQAVDDWLEGVDRQAEEFTRLEERRPLLGVPFTVKDNLQVDMLLE